MAFSAHILVETGFGQVAVVWSEHGKRPLVTEILLPGRRPSGSVPRSCPAMERLGDRLAASLEGEAVRFPLHQLRLDLLTPFQRKVLLALHAVPRGRVTTYGALAAAAGRPGACQAVGQVMAMNPFPIVIPCHRVVRSDLTLGGFGGGPALKRNLLELEGVRFRQDGRIERG